MRRPRNSVDEAIKKLSLSSTGEHQTQTTKLPPYSVGAQEIIEGPSFEWYFTCLFPQTIPYRFWMKNTLKSYIYLGQMTLPQPAIFLFLVQSSVGNQQRLVSHGNCYYLKFVTSGGWWGTGGSTTIFALENALSLSMQVISGTKSTKKIIIKKRLKKNRRGMNEMTEKTKKHTHLSKTFKFL